MADNHSSTPEEWRDVAGYEGLYQVSSLGRVRNIARRNGSRPGLVLRQNPDGPGYARVCLTKNGISRSVKPHRLVAAAFLGPAPDGYEVNHRDGDKMNPRADNLEYVTRTENVQHAMTSGLHTPSRLGVRNGSATLTDDDVRAIRHESKAGQSYAQIARARGIGKSTVARVVTREDWAHVQ